MSYENIVTLRDKIRKECFATDKNKFYSKIKISRINHRKAQIHHLPAISLIQSPKDTKELVDIDCSVRDFCEAIAELIWNFQQTLQGKHEIGLSKIAAEQDVLRREEIYDEMRKREFSEKAVSSVMAIDISEKEGPQLEDYLNSDDGYYETDQNHRGYGYKARENSLFFRLYAVLDDFLEHRGTFEGFVRAQNTLSLSDRDRYMVLTLALHATHPWDEVEIQRLFESLRKRMAVIRHITTEDPITKP